MEGFSKMTIYRQTPRFVWVTNAERPTHGYPIGSILFDEDDSKTVLHFEIWKGQAKLDPEGWLFKNN